MIIKYPPTIIPIQDCGRKRKKQAPSGPQPRHRQGGTGDFAKSRVGQVGFMAPES